WMLAAALGAATVTSMATVIHDTGRQNHAGRIILRATVQQLEMRAGERLAVVGSQTFAPVAPWIARTSLAPRAAVEALARDQHDGEACHCRETLASSEAFRFDVASGSIERTPIAANPPHLSDAILAALAQNEVRRAQSHPSPMHLVTAKNLTDHVALTYTQHDSGGSPIAVYGVIADARATAKMLFERRRRDSSAWDSVGVVRLDTLSLQIVTGDSSVLYGNLEIDRPVRASLLASAAGSFDGLRINLSLNPRQIATPLLEFLSPPALWHLGFLQISTVLMIAIAIAATRREVVLARARSDFIAGVSHDLRMPLAQILIAGETLTMQRERDEAQRLTLSSSIVRETRRLIALVENVLLFSRSGAVAVHAQLASVGVGSLFDDVIESVQLAVVDARQSIVVREGASLAVSADRALMRQALANLVDNALKYGAAGQHIYLGAVERSSALVHLYVEDEGPGIPRSQRERVFDAYERLSRDKSSDRTGSGLGLAVVRSIAQACGGRVWLEDAPTGGTRAVIELRASSLHEPTARTLETV
ncbi:MAG TPA: HAMP domain-containing sensor histidine kinase, partial [Gemmatimonadaceae bacterium]|nr:HAMP domain-containing sensor histidine kinase [Gemmatimonadaceae bacterium]